ncbi:MAG: aldo/keto reductase family oxidoreductase [Opitutales bacterium]
MYGCMRATGGQDMRNHTSEAVRHARETVEAALECGINFFDHADIYGSGDCEEAFGHVLKERPSLREEIVIQTKCGIRKAHEPMGSSPARYDFSYDHIVNSAEQSLQRLGIETIDILLLHRPDPLAEPAEVARAFEHLHSSGKARYFGVSNHSGYQIELLKRSIDQPLVANQLQFSLFHSGLIDAGTLVNQKRPEFHYPGEGTLEYCQLHSVSIQAWSPLAGGALGMIAQDKRAAPTLPETRGLVQQMAEAKNVSPEAILLAWIFRHPAGIQPVIGTTNTKRIRACGEATNISLSREEWYTLYTTARGLPTG